MMQLIMPEYYGEFVNDRAEMHRLRYRAFKQRLDWTVESAATWKWTNLTSFDRCIC